ncbi:MAG: sugar kinase, partial [Planctomycetota bacterium]
AGGMMGYLADRDDGMDPEVVKTAIAYGTVVASFNVEGFGLSRMKEISRDDIEARLADYRKMLSF